MNPTLNCIRTLLGPKGGNKREAFNPRGYDWWSPADLEGGEYGDEARRHESGPGRMLISFETAANLPPRRGGGAISVWPLQARHGSPGNGFPKAAIDGLAHQLLGDPKGVGEHKDGATAGTLRPAAADSVQGLVVKAASPAPRLQFPPGDNLCQQLVDGKSHGLDV